MSTFPQAAASTMQALRSTSLNLNPQQDGLKIYVSLPKVTREHRESVAKAAKSRSGHCYTQFCSVDFSPSWIGVKKCGFLLSNTIGFVSAVIDGVLLSL